ncbi:MAG: alpha-L-fucosidase [Phycisphaeraceae bacterium]|nr:alpha-L-fucosidase [Phycisphaeraceae bacterium]
MPSIRFAFLCALAVSLLAIGSHAAATQPDDDARMRWWREARFGLFIHWGLYSTLEGQWNGQTNHAEWIRTTAQIPIDQYDTLLDRFNPVRFDADAWCEMAARAGMKYIVITTKHHDGFALFDSGVSEFDVMSTPFHRDIMKELSESARRHGLKICWYHSIMDWHHPDYLPRRAWEQAQRPVGDADMARYIEYLRAQVRELLTRYGDIGVMWFDGEWESTWTREMGNELYALCREVQPDVIVNNRVSKGRAGMAGMTTGDGFAGDFGTPEQEVPSTGFPGVDWESCITMNANWGWNRADRNWKSSDDLIRMLVDIASKGGNLLLNVGPRPDGTFPDEAIERLDAIGRWMDVNGAAIHGTLASPFESLPWGRCTIHPNQGRHLDTTTMFLHVFDWPANGELLVPGLGSEVLGARLVVDGLAPIPRTSREGPNVRISGLPATPPFSSASVIALEIRGRPIVYETPRILAASDVLVRELPVRFSVRSQGLEIRYTLDGSDPTPTAARADDVVRLTQSTTVRAAAFHNGERVSAIAERRFTRVVPMASVVPAELEPGVELQVFRGSFDAMPEFNRLVPESVAVAEAIDLTHDPRAEYIAKRFIGYIDVPTEDVYQFALGSDDGSRLWVGGRLIVDNDGLHSPLEKHGTMALARGKHPIVVEWFNKSGGAQLDLRWAPVGGQLSPVPASALSHSTAEDPRPPRRNP